MFRHFNGNIWDLKVDWVIIPVNLEGVMGRGLAHQAKIKFPNYFQDYREACRTGRLKMGTIHFYGGLISFPTKTVWRLPSNLDYIRISLEALYREVKDWKDSIAFPKVGCGNGGLEWDKVRPMILKQLKDYRGVIYLND